MGDVVFDTGRSSQELIFATATIDPPNLTTGSDGVYSTTEIDVSLGDGVIALPPYDMEEVIHSAYVSAAGTVEVAFYNGNASTVDHKPGVWNFIIVKK